MWNQKPCMRFEIDNFSEKESALSSTAFTSGGCKWFIRVYPKGDSLSDDHLSLYLAVANRKSLQIGWKRTCNYYFLVLNHSDKELYRSPIGQLSTFFCAESPSWGFGKTLPLSKFQEKGFLENDKLIIEVYIRFVEVIDGEGDETVDINGFQVLVSQVTLVMKIFAEHSDIAEDVKLMNPSVKTAYMNVLIKLITKLDKSPDSLSETRLQEACSQLSELVEVGFKLDWLKLKLEELSLEKQKHDAHVSVLEKLDEQFKIFEKESSFKIDSMSSKLDEVSLEKNKADTEASRVQQLEERVKNLELMGSGFKIDGLKSKIEDVSLKMRKADAKASSVQQQLEERVKNLELMGSGFKIDGLKSKLEDVSLKMRKADAEASRVQQQLEERVNNLEKMELGFNLDSLNRKLYDVSLNRKKSDDADVSRAKKLEERIKMEIEFKMDGLDTKLEEGSLESKKSLVQLGIKLNCLNAKLEKLSLERKKSDDVNSSRVQKLEDSVKNIELMVTYLKVALDKKKDKTSEDGFLLVDEVA